MSLKTYISGIRSDDLLRTAVNHIYLFQDQNGCMHAITTVGSKCSLTDVNKETMLVLILVRVWDRIILLFMF